MGQLAFSVVGAGVGAYFGGSTGAQIGWMVGSIIGGLVFGNSTKTPMADLRVQNSAYGQPIPWAYGTVRVTGNVIWAGPATAHNDGGKGGSSGGGGNQTFYTMSFAVGICEGPVDALTRIWANGQLIYDVTNPSNFNVLNQSGQMVTNFGFYPGNETQNADPVMEAAITAGLCPPNRGLCYIVFYDFDVTAYGNVLPSISFEVVVNGTPTWVLSQSLLGANLPEYSGGGTRGMTGYYPNGAGIYGWTQWLGAGSIFYGTSWELDSSGFRRTGQGVEFGYKNGVIPTVSWDGDGGVMTTSGLYYLPGVSAAYISVGTPDGITSGDLGNSHCVKQDGCIMASYYDGGGHVGSGPLQVTDLITNLYAFWTAELSTFKPAGATEEYFYAMGISPQNDQYTNMLVQWKRKDGSLVRVISGWPSEMSGMGLYVFPQIIEDNMMYFADNVGNLCQFDGNVFSMVATGTLPFAQDSGVAALYASGLLSFGYVYSGGGAPADVEYFTNYTPPSGISVGEICADIMNRAGMDSSMYDVSLATDLVRGYAVTNGPNARDGMTPLLQMYYTDAADTDGAIKLVRRGVAPIVEIPYGDLGAANIESDAMAVQPLQRQSTDEATLPRSVAVTVYGYENDYNKNTQKAFRTQTISTSDVSITVPIVMTAAETLQAANTLMWARWLNANVFTFNTDLTYLWLEPTDMVTLMDEKGNLWPARLTKCTNTGNDVLEWTAELEYPSLYPAALSASTAPAVAPAIPKGHIPQTVGYAGRTFLTVLDVPPLRVVDATSVGVYLALSGAAGWPGASVDLSRDDSTFAQVTGSSTAAVQGQANSTLASFEGGNIPDEANSVNIILYDKDQTMQSISYANFLNNENVMYLGGEIIGFRNAVLQTDGTYTLSGLQRGMLGTEQYMGGHYPGEPFVLLIGNGAQGAGILPVTLNLTDYGDTLYLQTHTNSTVANDPIAPQTFQMEDGRVKPLSPVLFTAQEAGSGGTASLFMSWFRRARINYTWNDGTDVPLDESTEGYTITALVDSAVVWQYSFSATFAASGQVPNATWPATALSTGMTGAAFGSIASGTVITLEVQQHSDQGVLGLPASITFTKA